MSDCKHEDCPNYGNCTTGLACTGREPSPEICVNCCVGDSCVIGTENGVKPWFE